MNDLFNPADTVVELKTTNDEYNYELLSKSALASFLVQRRNDCILLKLKRPEAPGMLKNMVEMGIEVLSFHTKHSLEDYFLSLTSGYPHVEPIKN